MLNTSVFIKLNSLKHPQQPVEHIPISFDLIDCKSVFSVQLVMTQKIPNVCARSFTNEVLPELGTPAKFSKYKLIFSIIDL